MAKSFTQLRTDYGEDTKNTASANLTYGTTRMNDFHKRLLTKADWPFLHRDRRFTTFDPDSTFTAATDDIVTVADTIFPLTGTEVTVSSTTTLPAGLSANTTYFLIYLSDTTFNLATTLANALAGTVIDITDTGTGTHTITVQTRLWSLPYDIDLVESVEVTVSSTVYSPRAVPSRSFWNRLNFSNQISDTPQYWWVEHNKIALWPRPATSGNAIKVHGRIRTPDLNVADYTTGTIDIATNGAFELTGSSTVWTTPMAGRWLRITHSDTAASSGDGEWYEINSRESDTLIHLVRPYGGRSLTTGAGANYIIGQMPLIPEAYHDLLTMYAAYRYWLREDDANRTTFFKGAVDEGVSDLFQAYGFNDLTAVVDDGEDDFLRSPHLRNPNLFVSL